MRLIQYSVAALALGVMTWFGIQFFTGSEAIAQQEGAPQAMPIQTSVVNMQEVQPWHEFSGKLVAVDMVDIRPRVSGAIEKIYFEPGAIVETGTPLFLIDPRPYQAEVNRLSAALVSAQAQASLAKSESARATRLIKENAIAQRDFDSRQNALSVALAAVKSAEAGLQQAKLNLDYATIKAPVTGKISRAEITEGNLVDAGSGAPILASLVSLDPVYADFDVDEQTYLANVHVEPTANSQNSDVPVEMVLNNDKDAVVYKGKIVSFDNKLDPTAGTIRARAIFDNPGNRLVPGMFAKIRLGSAEKIDAILIPDRVVNTDQDKKFVYVVNAESKAEYRLVKLGGNSQGMRIVLDGLNDGDRIIVNGLMRVRPGAPVEPKDIPLTAKPQAIETQGEAAPDAAAAPSKEEALEVTQEAAEAPVETSAGEIAPIEPITPASDDAKAE